ncbi:hypothetical protein [Lysinibacillus xylanilyticus]|uniref:Uncharacterized protein n=1 Tax=Lysinibacillus xylanilyticus TaxID=582475 RepID=A0ABV3VW82_9BACI
MMNKLSENISKLSAEKKELLKKELQKNLIKKRKRLFRGKEGKPLSLYLQVNKGYFS